MSRFGSNKDANKATQSTENEAQDPVKQPTLDDSQKAQLNPPPTTDSLGLASATELVNAAEGRQATQEEIQKALQIQADKIQQSTQANAAAVDQATLTQGNVFSGALSTNNMAHSVLSQLGQEYDPGQNVQARPEGYYTVHFGSVQGSKGRIKCEQVGGMMYYAPNRLDSVAKAKLDKYVQVGMATYEGKKDDASAAAE